MMMLMILMLMMLVAVMVMSVHLVSMAAPVAHLHRYAHEGSAMRVSPVMSAMWHSTSERDGKDEEKETK